MLRFLYTKTNKRGFTLVELLVVVAVLALLMGIIVASLRDPQVNSRDTRRIRDMEEVQKAMELCYNDNACGPDGAGTYVTYPDYSSAQSGGIGTHMQALPNDPVAGRSYNWIDNTGDPQSYCIIADLEVGDYYYIANDGKGETAIGNSCP